MGKPRSCVLYIHSSVYIMVHCIYTSCQYPWTQWMGESLKQVLYLPSSKRANSPYVLCIHQTTKALWCHIMEGNFQQFCAPLLMLFIPLCNGEISREKLNFPWNLQFFKLTSSKIIVVSETTFSLDQSPLSLLLTDIIVTFPLPQEIAQRERDLQAREKNLERLGPILRENNFPPFPAFCPSPIKPCFYININVEVPPPERWKMWALLGLMICE